MNLKISADRSLPLKFLSLRKVVFGGSGSGKTSWSRVLFEEASESGVQCGAIDLKGDFWGLKSTASGKGDGIPVVIFGGEHQDVPLDEAGGTSLAEIVVELRQPFIVDLEQLSKGKQLKFLGAFFERLYDRNREPLVLICDEADRYAPQKPMSPEANICLGASEDIAKRGRKHGIFPVFVTQRNASLNKGVSELCDVAIVFRTPGPRDQQAVEDWFGTKATREQRDEVMTKLAGLETGTAVICSAHPDLKLFDTVKIREPWTFDSSATPEIGKRRIEPKRLAKPDLEQLRTKMAETIEKAKQEDPKELRRQLAESRSTIADLQRKLSKPAHIMTGNIPKAPKPPKRIEVSVLKDAHVKLLDITACRVEKLHSKTMTALADLSKVAVAIVQAKRPAPVAPGPVSSRMEEVRQQQRRVVDAGPRRQPTVMVSHARDGELPKGEQACLIAMVQHGPDGVTREQLTALTGYKRSTRDAYLQRLREKGLMAERGFGGMATGRCVASPAGIEWLGQDFEPLPTGEELQQHWLKKLPEGEARVLATVLEVYPKAIDREQITEATGYKRSTRDAYVQRLKTRELVETEVGTVRASEKLF